MNASKLFPAIVVTCALGVNSISGDGQTGKQG